MEAMQSVHTNIRGDKPSNTIYEAAIFIAKVVTTFVMTGAELASLRYSKIRNGPSEHSAKLPLTNAQIYNKHD